VSKAHHPSIQHQNEKKKRNNQSIEEKKHRKNTWVGNSLEDSHYDITTRPPASQPDR